MKRSTPLKRGKRLNSRNPKRRAKEWSRAYGSAERVQWLQSQPCAVPMCPRRPCECAHTPHASAGMGRKGDAASTIPLCANHHRELHACGVASFQRMHGGLSLAACAERTDALWQREVAA